MMKPEANELNPNLWPLINLSLVSFSKMFCEVFAARILQILSIAASSLDLEMKNQRHFTRAAGELPAGDQSNSDDDDQ